MIDDCKIDDCKIVDCNILTVLCLVLNVSELKGKRKFSMISCTHSLDLWQDGPRLLHKRTCTMLETGQPGEESHVPGRIQAVGTTRPLSMALSPKHLGRCRFCANTCGCIRIKWCSVLHTGVDWPWLWSPLCFSSCAWGCRSQCQLNSERAKRPQRAQSFTVCHKDKCTLWNASDAV